MTSECLRRGCHIDLIIISHDAILISSSRQQPEIALPLPLVTQIVMTIYKKHFQRNACILIQSS